MKDGIVMKLELCATSYMTTLEVYGIFCVNCESVSLILIGEIILIEEDDSAEVTEPFVMSKVSCTGSEQKLSQCSINFDAGNCNRVAISCLQDIGENILKI